MLHTPTRRQGFNLRTAAQAFPFYLRVRSFLSTALSDLRSFAILKRMLRRMLAITLLIAFGLPLAAPLLAASTDTDSNLPACCRRHGKHHCSMGIGSSAASSVAAFQAPPCPAYPTVATQCPGLAAALAVPPRIGADVHRDSRPAANAECAIQTFAEFAHLTRGPPSHLG
jgi:hypothetical protein